MVFYVQDTCRERARRLLGAQPLTVADIAEKLGTTTDRAGYVLRQLERQGAATRTRGGSSRAGRIPDQWRAAVTRHVGLTSESGPSAQHHRGT